MIDLIVARFPPPAWAVFTEVADRTGGPANRYADALAMSLWPSRGLELHGFEVKTDRRDWLRELKNPAKADAIASYCDRWWIVASKNLVQQGELPPTWGLLVAHGDGLRCAVEAPENAEAKPFDRSFVASILRNAHKKYDLGAGEAIAAATMKAVDEAHTQWRERDQQEVQDLRARMDAFEKASGLRIENWNVGRVGDAVRKLMDGAVERERQQLDAIRASAARIVERCDEEIGKQAAVRSTP